MTDGNEQIYPNPKATFDKGADPYATSPATTEPLFPGAVPASPHPQWHSDPWSEPATTGADPFAPVDAAPAAAEPSTTEKGSASTPRPERVQPAWVVAPESPQDFAQDPYAPAADMPVTEAPAPRPAAPAKHAPAISPAMLERQTAFEQRFAVVLDFMQHGAWPQALAKLRALRADFGEASHLDALIAEAELKAELMEQWSHKIKGRRLTVGQEWVLRRSLPFMLVLALFLAVALFYQNFLAPSREVLAQERALQSQLQEAKSLTQTGAYSAATMLYQGILAQDPLNQAAAQGLAVAQEQAGLAAGYDIALHVMRQGNLTRAANLFAGIQATSPAYRDVDVQLSRIETLRAAEAAFLEAETAFAQQRWLNAVQGYERAKQISAEFRTNQVQERLNAAYFYAAQQILAHWPTAEAGPEQARAYLRQAQSGANRQEAVALLGVLDVYFRGEQEVRQNDLRDAINLWRSIYDEQPTYLDGFLAEQLYRAYLALASQVALDGDKEYARQLYDLAAQLSVRDTSVARYQLALLAAPTPTPTPLPTNTPVPAPVVYAPPPAPEPTATPTPAMQFTGWIAFRSTREGSELVYVMQPDGSNQQRAPEEIRTRLDALYQRERLAPDGARAAVVQPAQGRSDANIYIQDSAGQRVAMLTDDNGDEYDPVWAPNGQWIAYVANHPGNDEIFVMRSDGSDKRRLTWNEWEWDKHPTWSPDSGQIAYFTNRTGPRQIWVMSVDGTNQRNISNNGYDDWDPVWLK